MTPRSLIALVVLGAAALAGGWYFGTATTPSEQTSIPSGGLMFPGLAQKLQDAARLEITHQGKQTVIEKRPDGAWGIASMRDYPVQEPKLRGVLTALTELRLAEPRTSDPAEYSRLGLDDPTGAVSSADLLRVLDGAGKPIAALIVGHRRVRSQGNGPDEVYVRRPDEKQTWLADGNLQVDADPSAWLDREILNISHDRIASVVVGDHALVFGQKDGKFTLTEPADHPKLADYKVDDVSRALEQLTLQAVKPDAEAPPGTEAGHTVFTTADGLAVAVTLLHADKDVWARFSVSGGKKAEADALNGRLAGWTYQIGSWKEEALVPTLDGLKAPEPTKPAATGLPPAIPAAPAAAAPLAAPTVAVPGGAPAATPVPEPAAVAAPAAVPAAAAPAPAVPPPAAETARPPASDTDKK